MKAFCGSDGRAEGFDSWPLDANTVYATGSPAETVKGLVRSSSLTQLGAAQGGSSRR